MLAHDFLRASAERTPAAVALIEPGVTATYGEVNRQANRVANLLLARSVRRGDRVIIGLENSVDMVAAYFGVMKAGAVAVPLPPGPRNDRFVRALEDCSPVAAIVDLPTARDAQNAVALAEIPSVFVAAGAAEAAGQAGTSALSFSDWQQALDAVSDADPRIRLIDLDLAAIIYTSGSTGLPRGAILSHLNITANTESIINYLHLTAADRVMCVLPFYYVYGLSLLHTHVCVGGSVVIDNRFAFPNVVLAAMKERHTTGFAGVPSTFSLLLHRSNLAKMTFPDLRYVTQAGGGLPPARIREWLEKMPSVPFYVMYGATEASARLTYLEPSDLHRKLGSIGKAIPNVEMLVVTEDGRIARPGEVGELVARGSNISSGYWANEDETREKFGPLGYRTGDLGYADEEGFLFLVGRKHDMIKVGAHRIGAKEIEDVLNEHPTIHEAAVIGVQHEILGEAPVAFVVTLDGGQPDVDSILAFCRARLAPHKIPIEFRALPSLPKSTVGKIDKAALRKAGAQAGPDASANSRSS